MQLNMNSQLHGLSRPRTAATKAIQQHGTFKQPTATMYWLTAALFLVFRITDTSSETHCP